VHPFVIHAYGGDLLPEQYAGRPTIQRGLTAWTCRMADKIVVTGRHMVNAASALGIQPDRMVLLPRGVDLDRYRPGLDATALRRRLGIPDRAPVILSPRYQVDESLYNLDTVVAAMTLVLRQVPDAVCVQLYGPAHERGRTALECDARDRGLGEAYKLVPGVDNTSMPRFYNLADVVVSIPSSDGFPVTVLEASACATPMVVTDLPYCSEWFQNGSNGLIVPVRDAGAVANGIVSLLNNPERRRQIGTAARQLVEVRADYRRCMDELETVYRDLLKNTADRKD
jgi:glycosyltransferase involved in cell wall biosynthesis